MFNFSCPSVSIYGPILDSGSLNNISNSGPFHESIRRVGGIQKSSLFSRDYLRGATVSFASTYGSVEFDCDISVGRNCRRNYIRIFVHERGRVSS